MQPTADTFIPTWTPFPSNTPPEPETVIMVVTSTTDPFAAQEAEDVGGADTNALTGDTAANDLAAAPTQEPAVLDADQVRATAIIEGATATQSFILTGTAQALGIGQPFSTATPTVGFDTIATATVPLVAGADCIDEVRAGDNLFRISQRYGLTVTEIATRNGISNINLIFPGQMLTIPGCGTTGYRPLPTSTPTAAPTAIGGTVPNTTTGGATNGATTSDGLFITFTPAAAAGGQCGAHTVVEGETLFQIAQASGVSVSSLAAANGIVNVDLIDMGDQLVVPCS
ncbi:MAG: LysM peptidoglycan-binding domain-containing protein [Anaerolineae bacterium]